MSKLLAFRAPDHLAQAILELATQSSKSQTEIIIDALTIGLGLPAAPLSPIEERLAELEERVLTIAKLETQMSVVVDRLDAIEVELTPIASPNPTKEQLKTEIAQQALFDLGLNPVELVAIDRKISPESSRDSSEAGISTPEFTQYVEPILKPYIKGGYYFRFDDVGQAKLKSTLQKQAKQLGFKSDPIKVDGESVRVWLNREYCLTSV